MKTLVFGGTGRLGKAVSKRLIERGDDVWQYGRNTEMLPQEAVNYVIFCQRDRNTEYQAAVRFTADILPTISFLDECAVVMVGSVAVGINDDRHTVEYQCAKAAVIQLMRHYSTKIRCNAVSPWAFTGDKPVLKMDEVVNVIEFLASPLSSGINGQNIIIDKGLQHRWN